MEEGDYIGCRRDAAMYFGKYMGCPGPYNAVTPGFLLEVLRQDWVNRENALSIFCARVQSIGTRLRDTGGDVGPTLDLRCGDPEPEVVLGNLWHFRPPIGHAPKSLKPLMDVGAFGVHPDVAVMYVLEQDIPDSHRDYLERLHGELQHDADSTPTGIAFTDLAKGHVPQLTGANTGLAAFSMLSGVTSAEDIIDLLIAVNTLSTRPFESAFFTYLDGHDIGSVWPVASQESASGETGWGSPEYSLVFTGEFRKTPSNYEGGARRLLIVDGEESWVRPGDFTKALVFAIARKTSNDGHGKIATVEPKLLGRDMSEIVGGWPRSMHKVAEHTKRAVAKSGRLGDLCLPCDRKLGFYELNWSPDQIDLDPIIKTYRECPATLSGDIESLLQLYLASQPDTV